MLADDFMSRLALLKADIATLGLTQSKLSRAVKASQGQVSRVLTGQSPKRSKLFERLCEYVEMQKTGISIAAVRDNQLLMEALSKTWDGTSGHAHALAVVIRSLGTLRERSS